ncbi:MAG: AMP-binding protein, partial [Lachnospiraceae bacterium]|nr:AMP-binding protein [Lachnospiraceae bacterium]
FMTKEIKELIEYNCNALQNSEGTYREIYEVMFRLTDNVMYETDDGYLVERTTFGEAKEKIDALSEAIYEKIGATHEYIALEMDNCPEWLIAFWAILRSGNKPYLVNLRHPRELSDGILKTLNIKYILGIRSTKLKGEFLDYNILWKKAEKYLSGNEEGSGERTAFDPEKEFENEIALSTSATSLKETICFYSGEKMTNQLLNTKAVLKENKRVSTFYNGEIKQLVFLPLYHIFGLVAVYFWFSYFGRIMVFMKDYSAESILTAVKLHEVTHIFAVPLFWNTIEKEIRKKLKERGPKTEAKFEKGIKICTTLQNIFPYAGARWSKKIMHEVTEELFGPSVLFCITGGSYLHDSTLAMFNGMGYPLFNGYGMSEIGITSVELAATPKLRNLNSIGRPFEGVQYRLDENGVLSVKSASACSKRMVDGQIIPMEEWFETGDILKEKDGRYYILGRSGDVVIGENGENINPDVLEQTFDVHEALQFSVLGLPATYKKEGLKGEVLSMVVSLPADITEEDVKTLTERIYSENGTLPLSHQVKDFYFTYDAIMPETAIKVGRKYLLRGIENGSIRLMPFANFKIDESRREVKELLTSEVAEKVRAIIAEGAGISIDQVGDDDHLMNDLGCDSITYYGILIKVCNVFGIEVEGPISGTYYTLRDIVESLEEIGIGADDISKDIALEVSDENEIITTGELRNEG